MNRTWTTLIGAAELRALLADGATPVIVDCSFDLMDTEAGERAWREGHLPGSHYLHLDRDLSGPKSGRNGRHPLPERSVFSATLGRLGVTPATQVIVLDRQGGTYAARLWWMLRWLGHEAVAVLDGGLQAWAAAGGDVDGSEPPPRAARPTRRPPAAGRRRERRRAGGAARPREAGRRARGRALSAARSSRWTRWPATSPAR